AATIRPSYPWDTEFIIAWEPVWCSWKPSSYLSNSCLCSLACNGRKVSVFGSPPIGAGTACRFNTGRHSHECVSRSSGSTTGNFEDQETLAPQSNEPPLARRPYRSQWPGLAELRQQ